MDEQESVTVEQDSGDGKVNVQVARNRPSVGVVVMATAAVLAVVLISYVLYRTLFILLLLFLALLIATAIEPIVNWLRRGPFNRSMGILVVYIGLFFILGAIIYIIVSVFFSQLGSFASAVSERVVEMRRGVEDIDNSFVRQQAGLFVDVADGFVRSISTPDAPSTDEEKAAAVTGLTLTVAEVFFAIVTIFVVAFYWLTERTRIKRGFISWFPAQRANRIRRVWDDIEVKVGGWVRGQLILMVTVGIVSAIGYFVLGIKFWPALALIIALAEAIPLVGPYIGTAPAILIALTQQGNDGLPLLLGMGDFGGITRALLVVAFAVVLQTIEGNVLVPRIMKNSVGISPLAVIVSILIGGVMAGLAGALVAVPLAGAVQVILSDIKAARESDAEFKAATEEAKRTREEADELVVAHPGRGGSETTVEGTT
jgi:predicted PurR-regulated permease PerM